MRIPLVLASVLLLISLLIDAYITLDLRKIRRKGILWKIYAATSVVCWIFIIVVLCLPKRSEDGNIYPLMWSLYWYLSLYLAKFIYVICSLVGKLVRKIDRNKDNNHISQWIGLVAGDLVVIVMAAGAFYTRYNIQVNNVEIRSPKVPPAFDGYKLAQISDLHVGTWGNDTAFLSNLVDSVNSLHPDLIVFTGDVVNQKTSELAPFLSVLSRLYAPDGVLSILGNHDYGDYVDWKTSSEREANNRRLAEYENQMGWNLLNNRRLFIERGNDSIMVIGVENWGDPPFPIYGDLEKALPSSADSIFNQNDKNFKILLTHNPEHWNRVVSKSTNIDLSLAGHTHAMQMMIRIGDWKWSPACYRYEQWGGLYERLNDKGHPTKLYVNIGAGEVGMPTRLLDATPEITLFTFRHQGN